MLYSRKAQLAFIAAAAITMTPGCECEGTTSKDPEKKEEEQQQGNQEGQQKVGGKTEDEWKRSLIDDAEKKCSKIDGKSKDDIVAEAQKNMVKKDDTYPKDTAVEKTDLKSLLALIDIDQESLKEVEDTEIQAKEGELDEERKVNFMAEYNNIQKLRAAIEALSKIGRKDFIADCDPSSWSADSVGGGDGTDAKNKHYEKIKTCIKTGTQLFSDIQYIDCSAGTMDGDHFTCTTPGTKNLVDLQSLNKIDDAVEKFLTDTTIGLGIVKVGSSAMAGFTTKCHLFVKTLNTVKVKNINAVPTTVAHAGGTSSVALANESLSMPRENSWTNPEGVGISNQCKNKCMNYPAGNILIGENGLVQNDDTGYKNVKDAEVASCPLIKRYAAFTLVMDAVAETLKELNTTLASTKYTHGKKKADLKDKREGVAAIVKKKYEVNLKKTLKLKQG